MTSRSASVSFWLSVLLHVLLFLSFILYLRLQPVEEKKPNKYVPAYVYKGAMTPVTRAPSVSQPTPVTQAQSTADDMAPAQKDIPLKRVVPAKKSRIGLNEIMASSYRYLQESQLQAIQTMVKKSEEPIYMIGDSNEEADPLIILLGRALSKHFQYPEMAGKFGIAGRVLVKLTLQPEGDITNVIIVESSDNHDLDSAALYAVNMAPRIKGADKYIQKPKTVVIGFIFRYGSRS